MTTPCGGRPSAIPPVAQRGHPGPDPLFFFFSSRRRHTRSDRDWSSDVCSSDLFLWSRVGDNLVWRHTALGGWMIRCVRLSSTMVRLVVAIKGLKELSDGVEG